MMTTVIVIVFLLGYCFITLEHNLKVNKTAVALLMSVACWVLYMSSCGQYVPLMHGAEFTHWLGEQGSAVSALKKFVLQEIFVDHVGDTSEIIFFLLGAMTIVEVVDANGAKVETTKDGKVKVTTADGQTVEVNVDKVKQTTKKT